MRTMLSRHRSLAFVALLGSLGCEATREPSVTTRELVVIDAGSSGTRARVFRFEPGRPDTLVGLGRTCENDLPLAQDISGVLASHACARPLLADPATPVIVFATGGMRSLAERDPEAATRRHAEVVAALHERGVLDVESRTITGADEAVFEWLGVNHQEGQLGPGSQTVTMLEFGGASVQVAFEVSSEIASALPPDELRELVIAGETRSVFVRSYLHCGMNEARESLATSACFAPGCADAPTCAAMQPAALGAASPAASTPPSGGDAPACRAAIGEALALDTATCGALARLPPRLPEQRPIRLISRLADTFVALGVVDDTHVDLAAALAQVEAVCAAPWVAPAIPADPAAPPPSSADPALCFAANHALVVLAAWGIGANDERVTITPIDHSWTWGVARVQAERLD